MRAPSSSEQYSSEPLGDYFAGPNHVLPTNGTAKFFSPLSRGRFHQEIQHHLLFQRGPAARYMRISYRFAEAEQLTAHANSIRVRFEKKRAPEMMHSNDTTAARTAEITRVTAETDIRLTLNLDGTGRADIHTGIGFFDHMLDGFARHGFFDLTVQVRGRSAGGHSPHH